MIAGPVNSQPDSFRPPPTGRASRRRRRRRLQRRGVDDRSEQQPPPSPSSWRKSLAAAPAAAGTLARGRRVPGSQPRCVHGGRRRRRRARCRRRQWWLSGGRRPRGCVRRDPADRRREQLRDAVRQGWMPLRNYSAEASIRHRSRYVSHSFYSRKKLYIWSHFATK